MNSTLNVPSLFQQASAYLKQGKYKAAETLYKQVRSDNGEGKNYVCLFDFFLVLINRLSNCFFSGSHSGPRARVWAWYRIIPGGRRKARERQRALRRVWWLAQGGKS